MAMKPLSVREEVLDHVSELFYSCLCKARHLANLVALEKWEEKERELHLLSQSLRETSMDEGYCSRFQLEQAWGIKSDNAEVMWSAMKSLGSVLEREEGCELVRVTDLVQVTCIALVTKEATLRRKEEGVLANEPSSSFATESQPPSQSPVDSSTRDKVELVVSHLESLLRLILGVPPTCLSTSLVVTTDDVDALGLWLRPVVKTKEGRSNFKLSELSPFFVSHLHASFRDVSGWLKGAVGPSTSDVVMRLKGAQKKLIFRQDPRESATDEVLACLTIDSCADSTIYCLLPIEFVRISNCKNCTVVVGSARFAQTTHCSSLKVITACRTKVISNCMDCVFYLGTNECPLLVGDNRHVTLAPYNSYYDGLPDHLECLRISGEVNYWNVAKVVDSPYSSDPVDHSGIFAVMPPEKWSSFVIPFASEENQGASAPAGEARPFLAPKAYRQNLEAMAKRVDEVRAKIAGSGLAEDQRQALQQVIRGHFKDWLLRDGHFNEIQRLSEMELAVK
ncbi:tubulin binding cofactor C [Chloropicon primus]|nr:tubulin binding cofactor C [Chloropicon primus]